MPRRITLIFFKNIILHLFSISVIKKTYKYPALSPVEALIRVIKIIYAEQKSFIPCCRVRLLHMFPWYARMSLFPSTRPSGWLPFDSAYRSVRLIYIISGVTGSNPTIVCNLSVSERLFIIFACNKSSFRGSGMVCISPTWIRTSQGERFDETTVLTIVDTCLQLCYNVRRTGRIHIT